MKHKVSGKFDKVMKQTYKRFLSANNEVIENAVNAVFGEGDSEEKTFFCQQLREHSGKLAAQKYNKNYQIGRYSRAELRLTMTIYSRFKAAFKALREMGILLLPSKRKMQYYASSRDRKDGWRFSQLTQCRNDYTECIRTEHNATVLDHLGEKHPHIFVSCDELKIIAGIVINVKTGEIVGFETPDEQQGNTSNFFD